MNKRIKLMVIVATVVIAFGAVGSVYAQGGGPGTNGGGLGQSFGNGFRGGNGERINQYQGIGQGTMDGVLHDAWMEAYADALGIDVDTLEERIAAGDSMSEVALDLGFTLDEFRQIKLDVRAIVIAQAVSDGTLTQEQATWMETRGVGMRNGMSRRGLGAGYEDCPNYGQNQ